MPAAKTVVEPVEAIERPPAPAADQKSGAPAKVVVFWKVRNPFEKILFADRSDFVFGSQSFSTADENLIKKINEVADRYGILVQKNGE